MALLKRFPFILLVLVMISCANKGKKPLLPFFSVLNEKLHPVWILPHDDISHFQKLIPISVFDYNGNFSRFKDTSSTPIVLNFFTTTCIGECPEVMDQLLILQNRLTENDPISINSLSTLPSDTPEKLESFGLTRGVKHRKWQLFGTSSKDLDALLKNTLNTNYTDLSKSQDLYKLLFLFDSRGYLRGTYKGDDPIEIENLILDLKLL